MDGPEWSVVAWYHETRDKQVMAMKGVLTRPYFLQLKSFQFNSIYFFSYSLVRSKDNPYLQTLWESSEIIFLFFARWLTQLISGLGNQTIGVVKSYIYSQLSYSLRSCWKACHLTSIVTWSSVTADFIHSSFQDEGGTVFRILVTTQTLMRQACSG